jgi:HAE1 family hydrophobic/amphiphilic exporter-1
VIDFFLRRPIFAAVCSLIIVLAGAVSIPTLPIAQFPQIAPPVVTVTSTYTGASAQTVEDSVTTILEEGINGVEGLRYISSQSSNDGTSTITCTFDLGRNLDIAAADVQNAIQTVQARLPAEVTAYGITVNKNAGSFVMGLGLSSHFNSTTSLTLSNYADLYVKNELKRVPGVSDVIIFGERKYAMRLWLDPKKMADNGLAASDVVSALQDQNVQVASGSIGAPPTNGNQPYQISVRAIGRLTTPDQFMGIIVKNTADGGHVYLRDVGRAELGAESYTSDLHFNGRSAVGLGVQALPTSNALDVSRAVRARMNELSQKFPAGMYYDVAFDATTFVNESIKEVIITLFISILLVVVVIYFFLQSWRTTLIPAITIPVSLIGTFALMKALGFSINTLTLFGLTLATGLVVDDAIVVIENIARFIQEKKMSPLAGASAAMNEITGAVVASSLVLLAVFVPVAFFPGETGQLYKQFALTIACSIAISLFNALTLTPTLSALLLGRSERPTQGVFKAINRAIDRTRKTYHSALGSIFRFRAVVIVLFVCALVLTGFLFRSTSTGFTPDEDQGYFIATVQLPEGSSIDQTERVTAKIESELRQRSEILRIFDIIGFGFTGNGPNKATMFVLLKDWKDRPDWNSSVIGLLYGPKGLQSEFSQLTEAQVFAFNPPSIQGVGNVGGFQYELQDRANVGLTDLNRVAYEFMGAAATDPNLRNVYTTFRNDNPQLVVNVDRAKAQSLGIPLANVFNTMQVFLGSLYVNDFDYLNRSYRVYVQADEPYRATLRDLQNIYVKSSSGAIMPLTTLISSTQDRAAPVITHYNLFRSIELSGQPAAGKGSGDAINEMEKLAKKFEVGGISHEWSGISLDEIESGGQSTILFGLGIIVVFLVLAAQYESWTDPLIILMSVPLAILGALLAIMLHNFLNVISQILYFGLHLTFVQPLGTIVSDVYAQVGYVMLIGLASKNAILIVEFANQLREQGLDAASAARQAAETRLRPILMTSFAFILGLLPLVLATGAGSSSRHSLGTPVMGGMILSTFLNLVLVPVVYVMVSNIRDRFKPAGHDGPSATPRAAGESPELSTASV